MQLLHQPAVNPRLLAQCEQPVPVLSADQLRHFGKKIRAQPTVAVHGFDQLRTPLGLVEILQNFLEQLSVVMLPALIDAKPDGMHGDGDETPEHGNGREANGR